MRRSALWLLVALATSACSSTRPPSIYTSALNTLCEQSLLLDGAPQVIAATTGVIPLAAIWQHYNPQPLTIADVETFTRSEEELLRTFKPERFALPQDGRCVWRATRKRKFDMSTLVELSFVVPEGVAFNPTVGIFGRVSLGGAPGADFYWLPIMDGQRIGKPVKLQIDDG
ncbi:MAG TPA: hypothetical protein VGQ76_15550 [Thermoanaerobaculia bacterium]|jgi:hypothetical protein|nr:hypothetical protein [Thermoanaerobaculia bacterium]